MCVIRVLDFSAGFPAYMAVELGGCNRMFALGSLASASAGRFLDASSAPEMKRDGGDNNTPVHMLS